MEEVLRQNKPSGVGIGSMKNYTGRYHSDEVNANLVIKFEKGNLIIERKGNQRYMLISDTGDIFKVKDSNVSVKFIRDQSARLTGLSFTTPRVRNVVFKLVIPRSLIKNDHWKLT